MTSILHPQWQENDQQITPTLGEYTFEAGKHTLEVLAIMASSSGVPFAKDAVHMALTLINLCEVSGCWASRSTYSHRHALGSNCHQRAGQGCEGSHLWSHARHRQKGSWKGISWTWKWTSGRDRDCKEVHVPHFDCSCAIYVLIKIYTFRVSSDLTKIADELREIWDQSRCLTFFFKTLNRSKIEDCVQHLQETLERFQVTTTSCCPSMSLRFSIAVTRIADSRRPSEHTEVIGKIMRFHGTCCQSVGFDGEDA